MIPDVPDNTCNEDYSCQNEQPPPVPTQKPTPLINPWPTWGGVNPTSDHIEKWQASVGAVQIHNFEDIPSDCANTSYDVALNSFVDQGSHFFLTATQSDDNANCPEVIAFASMRGRKVVYLIEKEKMAKVDINTHLLGKASLDDIAKAENDAKAVDDSKSD
jgi:hypothetical protein